MQERLFNTDQVADLLGTTSREVRQWIAKGWLPSHAGPDGVDRVSESGLIQFLKGRGIDIMQLMVSTAVEQGYRAKPAADRDRPAEAGIAPPMRDAELLGEESAGGPGPEVLSASDGPAGPSIDEDVASALAARQMLTDTHVPKDTHEPAPLPSLDLAYPRGHHSARPAIEADYEAEPANEPTPAEQAEAATKAAMMNAASSAGSKAAPGELPGRPGGLGAQTGAGKPSQILDQEELTALLGSPLGAAPMSQADDEAPEGVQEADDDGPFLAGAYEAGPPIEEQQEQSPADEALDEQWEPGSPEADEQDYQGSATGEPDFDEQDEDELPDDEPSPQAHAAAVAAQLASAVLDDAVRREATHVHLHSKPSGAMLRMRIDGRLREKPNFRGLPGRVESALVTKLLDLAGLAGADLARPQSGQFVHEVDGLAVRMTLASFPTTHGPRLAISLPPRTQTPAGLAELGARPVDAEHIHRLLTSRRGGLLLVCGLTGDDRGGVLRALAWQLAGAGRDVLVIDADGVEVPQASNSSVDPIEGYRFRDAARHLAEQDADAIVLAQLRDPTTANAAIEAAIGGAMVVAGISAPTAAEALGTLAEMDVESWPLSTMLRGVIVCRTLRRLCRACRKPVQTPRRLPNGVRIPRGDIGERTFAAVGCPRCGKTGHDGKVRLLSLLRPDRQIVRLVRVAAAADTIAATVRGAAAEALMALAAEHVRAGNVSLDDLTRLT